MADINQIIAQKAIDGILATDKAITSLDERTLKFVKSVEKLNTELKKGGVTFKQVQEIQKQAEKTQKKQTDLTKQQEAATKALDKQRQRAFAQMAKQEAKEREYQAALKMTVKSEDDLIKKTNALVKQRRQLDQTTEAGRKKHAALTAEIKKNTDQLKSQDKQIGRSFRNVGNYSGALQGLASQFGLIPPQASAATGAIGGVTKGLKGVRLAIMSTGIGALIIALGSLVSYFQSTEEGAAKLQKTLSPFKILFGNITDLASDLGEGIVNAFENPKEAVISLWNGIKQNFVNRIKATTKFISAFGSILQGVWELDTDKIKSSVKEAGNAYVDMLTGVENTTQKVQENISGFVEETRKENEKNVEVIERQLALDKRRRAFKVEEAKLLTQIAKQRLIANDDEQTALAQQEAINKAIELNAQLSSKRAAIEREDLELLKTRASFSDSNAETLDEIADKEAEIITLKKTQDDLERSLLRRKTTINNKVDAQIEKQKELLNTIAEGSDETDYVNSIISQLEEELAVEMDFINQEIDANASKEEEITKKQEEEEEKRKQARQQAFDQSVALVNALFDLKQTRIDKEISDVQAQRDFELKLAGDNRQKQEQINKKYDAKEAKLKTEKAESEKKQAIFNATIQTAQAVVQALNNPWPLNLILAALSGALGAVQIATIASQPIPQFYTGTESAPDGVISVGERGRELIETKSGKMFMANKPTLASGLKGAKIYNNRETEMILNNDRSSIQRLDISELSEKQDRTNDILRRMAKLSHKGDIIDLMGNGKKIGV